MSWTFPMCENDDYSKSHQLMHDFLDYTDKLIIGQQAKITTLRWTNADRIVCSICATNVYMSYGVNYDFGETQIHLDIWQNSKAISTNTERLGQIPDEYSRLRERGALDVSEISVSHNEIFAEHYDYYLRRRFNIEKIFKFVDGKIFWNDEFIPQNVFLLTN